MIALVAQTANFDAVNRVSFLESKWYMLNMLLRDSDVMSMAHGLEVRVPFLDQQLAECVLRLPGAWKLDGLGKQPKPMLLRALNGSVAHTLPPEIVNRPKRGFTLPFDHWMRNELRGDMERASAAIPHGPLAEVLDTREVQRVWRRFLAGETYWSRPWSLLVLQSWCERNL